MDLLEKIVTLVVDKLRFNVLAIAVLLMFIITDFGDKLIGLLGEAEVDPDLIITVLVSLISVGIGGLITAMVRMFESPSVPADFAERVIRQMREESNDG